MPHIRTPGIEGFDEPLKYTPPQHHLEHHMAKKVVETFVDDLDGGEASGTIAFAIEGSAYEIDLSDENADKLREVLAPFINAARPVRQERQGRGRRGAGAGGSRAIDREKSAKIREWAKSRGLNVSERGRIASSIVEQYEAAH
jgi:hypothetical protein